MKELALIVLSVAGGTGLALQPSFSGTWKLWAVLAVPYLFLSLWAIAYLRRLPDSAAMLRVKGGDTSIGVVLGLLLAGSAFGLQSAVGQPLTPVGRWTYQIYAQVGAYQSAPVLILLLLAVIAMEELVWRGLVFGRLRQSLGIWAIPAGSVLYALAQAPTLIALRDPVAGLNPLPMAAALICGIVWSSGLVLARRLFPMFLAHVVFTFLVASPPPAWLPF